MKQIESVSIWDNGQVKEAKILNSYGTNVALGVSASFYYGLFETNEDGSVGSRVAQGNVSMTGEAYQQWEQDNFAWSWIAEQLNLTIVGDYVPPAPPEPVVPEIEAPATSESPEVEAPENEGEVDAEAEEGV
jgi:hypothetical protein